MSLSLAIRHAFPGFSLDVAFEAPPGVTALFGRSGSGKTTIVNAVAGLLRPDRGHAVVNGTALFDTAARHWLPPHRRRIGYVFQEGRLFPHLTVRQNLAYGSWFAPREGRTENFDHVVEMLGIGPLLPRRPDRLSGGEKQRVAIGRALLSGPGLILADEPLAALDDERKAEILPYFERIRDEVSVPILYVSHSLAEVARLSTFVVALKEGSVLRTGPAAEVLGDPDVAPSLGIRGAGAVVSVVVVAHHADGLTELDAEGNALFLPRIGAAPGSRLRIRIAAQDVILSRARPEGLSALNILPGTIREVRIGDGPGAMVVLRIGTQVLLARLTRRSAESLALAPGDTCHAIMKSVAVDPGDIGAQSAPSREGLKPED